MENLKNKSTKKTLEDISQHCFTNMVPFKHSKHLYRGSLKYRKGRITAYDWINNLTYYYLKQEENLKDKFILNLKFKLEEIEILNNGEYKKGIRDSIDEILKELK